MMDRKAAEGAFRRADEAFRAGRYNEALAALHALDAAFPDEPRVQFPMARSFAELGNFTAALRICDGLIGRGGHAEAAALKARILDQQKLEVETIAESARVVDDLLAGGGAFGVPPVHTAVPDRRRMWTALGLSIVVVFAGVTVYFALADPPGTRGPETEETRRPATEEDGADSLLWRGLFGLGTGLAAGYVVNVIMCALLLTMLNRNPGNGFRENIGEWAFVALALSAIGLVPCVGIFVAIYYVHERYDLGLGETVIFAVFYLALGGLVYSYVYSLIS